MSKNSAISGARTARLGLAIARFMGERGLKTAYVRQQCQIGMGRLNSLKKVN